jgi:hypothetical protein
MSGRNQIHSGEGDFTFFTNLSPLAWYDLRLFQPFNVEVVQQADIVRPDGEAFSLRRSGTGWIMLGENVFAEPLRVEAWLRAVIEAQGDDFVFDAPENIQGSITLRLGDGSTRTLEIGTVGEHGAWHLTVPGSPYVYSLSDWSFNRIFREKEHFLRD